MLIYLQIRVQNWSLRLEINSDWIYVFICGEYGQFSVSSCYAASKAAIVGLTKTLALEYAEYGVRVNALLPGGTDTPIAKDFAQSEEVIQYVKNIHALKRMAQPEEIAQAALFLASNQASFITGSAMLVDGGVSIQK